MSETYFVPNGDNRRETAVLLLGTAEENGIDPRTVKAVNGGFNINEALANVLAEEMGDPDEAEAEAEAEAEPETTSTTTKTSGKRAAKK